MKIGEYLINEKLITQEDLNEALVLQEREKNMLLGEILVKMGRFSKEDLGKYVQDFMNKLKETSIKDPSKETIIKDTSQWLSQEDVDKLSSQYFDKD
jgi:polyhydroxyalkanoate synthesis regulator phasin